MIRAVGAAAVAQRLETLAEAIPRSLTAAMALEANALETEAKRRCPVKTGELRDSIRAELQTAGETTKAVVGSQLRYAAAVEMGTLARPPKPYLAPALQARKPLWTEHMKQAVHHAVKGDVE